MKIAVCYYGKFTGGSSRGWEIPFEYLKSAFTFTPYKYEYDIYLHGWDDDEKESEKLISTIKPKDYLLEKQIVFNRDRENRYSTFYSVQKSVDLVHGNYDFILLIRYDTVLFSPIPFHLLNKNCFYATHWDQNYLDYGYNDGWFIGGSNIMKEYSKIYDRLDDYYSRDEYKNFLSIRNDVGESPLSIETGHGPWRYRIEELKLNDSVYYIGCEFLTWGLLRRIDIRTGWSPDVNIHIPTKANEYV